MCHAPQENSVLDKKKNVWARLGNEVDDAMENEKAFILQMDRNLHVGESVIKGAPNPCNNNGKLLIKFLQKYHQLKIVNSLDLCEGVITRKRIANSIVEEAVLDFFIVCDKIVDSIEAMKIAEEDGLVHFTKGKTIESDHSPLILSLKMKVPQMKTERKTILDLLNRELIEVFKKETSGT